MKGSFMGVQEGSFKSAGHPHAISSFGERYGVHVFLISFTCIYYISNAPILLGHTDLGWHLAAGDLIRAQGAIPLHDPWSFTSADRPWYNLSWLWDVLASVLFQYTGFVGLTVSVLACGAAIAGYLTSIGLRSGASAATVCCAVFAACLLYPSFATAPNSYLAASPNTMTMLFCVVFYAECIKRTRWLLLPALMVLWVNLHGGFLLGFLIIGAFGGMALLRRDWAGVRIYLAAGIGCLIAMFVNPLGWHIYDGVTATLGDFVQSHISEWRPYFQSLTMPGSLPGVVYIVVFVALELRYRVACPIESRLLAWAFLVLGIYQFRYMSFFFMFSTVPLALNLERLLPKQMNVAEVRKALMAAGIAGACVLPVAFMYMRPTFRLPDVVSRQDALYVQTHFPHARLLNHWNFGGPFIFHTRGAVPVFVDGRAATAYPEALLRDYFKLATPTIDEAAWDMVLAKYNIDTVLWVRAHEALRQFLVGKRGWTEAYDGPYATVYVKPGASQDRAR
ncbi:MAG: hypothetical protein ACTHLO_02055 [Pseudolabrys sp.]